MFKRVITANLGKNNPSIETVDDYESLEDMESAPLFEIAGDWLDKVIVKEYEDDTLLRYYEYLDPTRSAEYSISTINNDPKFFGIKVEIVTRNEHGELFNYKTPAHVHIKSIDNMALCKLNITGECPRDNNSLQQCMFDIKTKKAVEYINKMVVWANYVRTTKRGKIKNWDFAKSWWRDNIETIGKNQDEVDSRRRGNGKPK
jgi:hypothetical protein